MSTRIPTQRETKDDEDEEAVKETIHILAINYNTYKCYIRKSIKIKNKIKIGYSVIQIKSYKYQLSDGENELRDQ